MIIRKKFFITLGLLSAVALTSLVSLKSDPEPEKVKWKNLKVLPKNISKENLHGVMEEWEHALGVKCNFCHVRDTATRKMDWVSDAKPEKSMARKMFKMTAMLNQKYFEAKKDSLGMMAEEGVNCNSCHRGVEHPEVVKAHHEDAEGGH